MRKVIAGLFVTLDGATQRPEQWQGPYMDAELGQLLGATMAEADTVLLGRRTYEEWAAFWPHQGDENPFAAQINAAPKLVASTTLETVAWSNSRLIRGDVVEELATLKQKPGKNILINGSATLVRSLINAGALDELRLLLHPVVVDGDGSRRLFEGVAPTTMNLEQARSLSSGVVSLTYRPARA
jgi:dihydrofolate reductase